jgi:hypothetical protein
MKELEEASSPSPSEIIAKLSPPFLVETRPNRKPNASPARPPTSGIAGTGTGSREWIAAFMAWIATKPPRPK